MILAFWRKPKHKPLPVGMNEFHEWSERIIDKAGLPASLESQKYTLANMLLGLPSGVSKWPDEGFVESIQRAASNQCALYYTQKIYPAVKAIIKAEEDKQNQAAASGAPQVTDVGEVLAVPGIQKT